MSNKLVSGRNMVVPLVMMLIVGVTYPLQVESTIGVNFGTLTSHQFGEKYAITLTKSYGFTAIKLFSAYRRMLNALVDHPDIEVMVACGNFELKDLARYKNAASDWVRRNIEAYKIRGANIKYIAVGNEVFLRDYKDEYKHFVLPALENIYQALEDRQLHNDIKLTLPLNGDVLSDENVPVSQASFRQDVAPLMGQIVRFLYKTGGAFTINIYPFLSLQKDPNFPLEYAFLDGSYIVGDGENVYHSAFEAMVDMLITALTKQGVPDLHIIVGEVGWPTEGHEQATIPYAQRFNQGIIDFLENGWGTPLLKNRTIDVYFFALLDEDKKSTQPGEFELYWGLANDFGLPKYPLYIRNDTNWQENIYNDSCFQGSCVIANHFASSAEEMTTTWVHLLGGNLLMLIALLLWG